MQGIIDRIEGDILVVECNEKMYDVDKNSIEAQDFKEGDVVQVEFEDDKIISLRKDDSATEDRKKYIEELTKNMWS